MDIINGFLWFLAGIIVWIFVTMIISHRVDKAMLLERRAKQSSIPVSKALTIVSKTNPIGRYKDCVIWKNVLLDDNRAFVFESIAIARSPGVFYADTKGVYMVVDNHFLYREDK